MRFARKFGQVTHLVTLHNTRNSLLIYKGKMELFFFAYLTYISEKRITQNILCLKFFAYILAKKKITQETLRQNFRPYI